jgi:hypothetical protein
VDPVVGDIEGNVAKLIHVLAESRGADAHRGQADWVVPDLPITHRW